jgi:hypothetical protein
MGDRKPTHRVEPGKAILCGRECKADPNYDPNRYITDPWEHEVVYAVPKVTIFNAEACDRKFGKEKDN